MTEQLTKIPEDGEYTNTRAEISLEDKVYFDDLLKKIEGEVLEYKSNTEDIVSLREQLRDGGTKLSLYIIGLIYDLLLKKKDEDRRSVNRKRSEIYHYSKHIYYSANSEVAPRLGELLQEDSIVGQTDRSTKYALLDILKRVGTIDNVEHLKKYAGKSLDTPYEGGQNFNRGDVINAVCVLLYIKKRLVDKGEIELVDQTIEDINKEVIERGCAPIKVADVLRDYSIDANALWVNYDQEFVVMTPAQQEQQEDIGWDDYNDYHGYPSSNRELSEGRHRTIPEEEQNIINKVNSIALKEDVAPTAVSAIQLHMYNYLVNNSEATEAETQSEYVKIKRLSDRENSYGDIRNPLPTIGIEIEIPNYVLTEEKIAVLDGFLISNKAEIDNLWEVNPDYSYSAGVQSRIIQELACMGALPIDMKTGKVNGPPLSLHINFGMPKGITESVLLKYSRLINELNDLVIYGFTSADRIMSRKTTTSSSIKSYAKSSKKSEPTKRMNENSSEIIRLELRAGEFKDYPTFRMLAEAQRLVAMLISCIKNEQKMPVTTIEKRLADLWMDFEIEMSCLLAVETPGLNLVDSDPEKAVQLLNDTSIKEECRNLISHYSRRVATILEQGISSK